MGEPDQIEHVEPERFVLVVDLAPDLTEADLTRDIALADAVRDAGAVGELARAAVPEPR